MRILRLGGFNLATSRFLDLIEKYDLERMIIFLDEKEAHYILDLYDTASFFGVGHLLKKLSIRKCSQLGALSKALRKAGKSVHSRFLMRMAYLNLASQLKRCDSFDAVWIGDNDFDDSNDLFVATMPSFPKGIPIIRSYKETRFIKRWEEFVTLSTVGHVIFPSRTYLDFFKDLYGLNLDKTSFADLDWRYSRTIRWVKSIETEKLSEHDHRPHVCILTGRALPDPSELRSGHRYYFIPVIKELIERGIAVHLHAARIVTDYLGRNLYAEIARSSNHFHVEKPLKLTAGSDGYRILKRYDAGILHPRIPEGNRSLQRFQQINIPNRIYEYQIADVAPLVQAGTSKEVERVIADTNFGIIFRDYDDLSMKLFELVDGKIQNRLSTEKIRSYKDFADILIQAIKTMT